MTESTTASLFYSLNVPPYNLRCRVSHQDAFEQRPSLSLIRRQCVFRGFQVVQLRIDKNLIESPYDDDYNIINR
jgi:hypothetical protein